MKMLPEFSGNLRLYFSGLLVGGLLLSGISLAQPAFADRSDVTIKMPGVQVRQHKGWFGTGGTQYKDALGNNYGYSRGVLGGETVSGGVLGNRISQSRSGIFNTHSTVVTAPDNSVMVAQKRSLFGKRTTVIDGESMYQNLKNVFHAPPVMNAPATP